jgi:hypothetical protein
VGVAPLASAWLTFFLVGMADTIFLSSIANLFHASNADILVIDVATLAVWLLYDIRNVRRRQQPWQPAVASKRMLLDIFDLIFNPKQLAERAVEVAFQQESQSNTQFAEAYGKTGLPDDKRKSWYDSQLDQISRLRHSITVSFLTLLGVLLFSLFTVLIIHSLGFWFSDGGILTLRLASSGLILWATSARLGWEIQSWSGKTLAERLNATWFRILYISGVFFGALSVWEPNLR